MKYKVLIFGVTALMCAVVYYEIFICDGAESSLVVETAREHAISGVGQANEIVIRVNVDDEEIQLVPRNQSLFHGVQPAECILTMSRSAGYWFAVTVRVKGPESDTVYVCFVDEKAAIAARHPRNNDRMVIPVNFGRCCDCPERSNILSVSNRFMSLTVIVGETSNGRVTTGQCCILDYVGGGLFGGRKGVFATADWVPLNSFGGSAPGE